MLPSMRSVLPPELLPPGYGPIQNEMAAAPRKLHHEENINRQVQLCTFLRSTGQPWSEAVFALRALCIGLEDDAFNKAWSTGWSANAHQEGTEIVYEPTNTQTAAAFAILMDLLSRWGMTFHKRIVSKTPQLPTRTPHPTLQRTQEDLQEATEATL